MSEYFKANKKPRKGTAERFAFRAMLLAALFLSTVLFPWWVSGAIAIFGMTRLPLYFEAVIAALLFDSLFLIPIQLRLPFAPDFAFQYFFLAASFIALFIVEMLKKRMRN